MPRNAPPRFPAITIADTHKAGARPLDWEHVVDAAAARLEESWVRPDATGYMMTSGMAEEFAATLCAYGMAAAEADHMLDRMDEALTHHRHVLKDSRVAPGGMTKRAVVVAG